MNIVIIITVMANWIVSGNRFDLGYHTISIKSKQVYNKY